MRGEVLGGSAIIAPKPFTPQVARIPIAEGATLRTILTAAVRSGVLDMNDLERTAVFVDGERVTGRTPEERRACLDLVPPVGAQVNVVVEVHGGGGGNSGQKIGQLVLTLAVVAATFFIAGPGFAAATGLAGPSLFAAQVAATVVVGAAAAGVAALLAKIGQNTNGQQYSLSGQSNQLRRKASMPLIMGRRRFAFDVAGSAFTTFDGSDTYLTVMMGVHYGPCTLEAIELGNTPLSEYDPATYTLEQFLTPGPRASALYASRRAQDTFQEELSRLLPSYTMKTTELDCERIEVDLYCPQLYFQKTSGTVNSDVLIQIGYTVHGANAWYAPPGVGANYKISGNTKDPVRVTVGWDVPKGQYDVRMSRNTHADDSNVDATYWTAIRTIQNDVPAIIDTTLSIIVLKFKASESLDNTIPVISGIVTPIVPIFDGTNWGNPQPSSNPAALVRWLLTGPAAATPLDPSLIDDSCGDAYQLIVANNWFGGLAITQDMTQADALQQLALMGRFAIYWNGSSVCFVPDWDKPAPRQMFNERNVSGYRYKRTFPQTDVHAVIVEFPNLDEDSADDEMWVYNDGFTETNSTLFETLTLPYACTMDRAHREGRVYLAKRKLQVETHEWAAGIDALACTLGDRVLLRHTSSLFGEGESRCQFRRLQGGLVSGVRLDTAITFQTDGSYAIDVRRGAEIFRGLAIIGPGAGVTVREITFATPMATDEAPQAGDLISFGVVETVTEDLEVIDVAPASDESVNLRAYRYLAADIMAAETGPIPALQSTLTSRTGAPTPRILSTSGDPTGAKVSFDVDTTGRTSPISGFTARWRKSASGDAPAGTWNPLAALGAGARMVVTPAFPDAAVTPGNTAPAYQCDVGIRTTLQNGDTSDEALTSPILITRSVDGLTGFEAQGVTRMNPDGSSHGAIAVTADPITAGITADLVVEIAEGASPADAAFTSLGTLPAANPVGDFTGTKVGILFTLRGRWRTADGWLGDYEEATATVPAGSNAAASVLNLPTDVQSIVDQVAAAQTAASDASAAAVAANAQATAAGQAAAQALASLQAVTSTLDGGVYGQLLGVVTDDQAQAYAKANTVDTKTLRSSVQAMVAEDTLGGAWSILQTKVVDQNGVSLSENLNVLGSTLNGNLANAVSVLITKTDANSAITQSQTLLTSQYQAAISSATINLITSSAANSAIAASATTLSAQFQQSIASATSNLITTSDANSAIATSATNLTSQFQTSIANATSGLITTANANSAIAQSATNLRTELNGNIGTATANLVSFSAMNSAISAATTNLASTTGVNLAIANATQNMVTTTSLSQALATYNFGQSSSFQQSIANATSTFVTQSTMSGAISTAVSNYDAQVPGGLKASVNTTAAAIANAGGLAAYLQLTATTPNGQALVRLLSSSTGSEVLLDALKIFFGTGVLVETATSTQHYTVGSVQFVIGSGFGGNANLLLWCGSSNTATGNMTTANAFVYLNTAGQLGGPGVPAGGGSSGGAGVKVVNGVLSSGAFISTNITAPTAGFIDITLTLPNRMNQQVTGSATFYINNSAQGSVGFTSRGTEAGANGSYYEIAETSGTGMSLKLQVPAGSIPIAILSSGDVSGYSSQDQAQAAIEFFPIIN